MGARVAYIETYFTGSHARIAELFRDHSRHHIHIYALGQEHWRWRALTAHYGIAKLVEQSGEAAPDALIISGPVQLACLLQSLPRDWASRPCAVYFHESQWSYPGAPYDSRPYVVGHLDALSLAHRVWFNSAYHRSVFRYAATHNRSLRMRKLAREVLGAHWHKAAVLYPPVQVGENHGSVPPSSREAPRICWVARWESDKRPDLFVEAIEQLRARSIPFELAIFPGGSNRSLRGDPLYDRIHHLDVIGHPLISREEYERELAACDVLVSTAEHEFFGVAVLEAAMLGVIPLIPDALAYPETIPSAPRYKPGNVDHLVSSLSAVLSHSWKGPAPWQLDSARFVPGRTVAAFDRAIDDLVSLGQ